MHKVQIRSCLLSILLVSLPGLVACSGGGSGSGKVVQETTINIVSITQSITLGAGTPYETKLKVPPGASSTGTPIKVSLKSGVPFGSFTSDAAIEVGPSDVVIANPLRARRRVPAPPPRRRYVAVQNDPAGGATAVRGSARRIYDPEAPSDGQTEIWEADLDAAGVWGIALDPTPLGVTDDGAQLEDAVAFFETEEPEQLLVGPVGHRRILTIPAAAPATPMFPGPVNAPKVWENRGVIFNDALSPITQAQTATRSRTPTVAEVVTIAPPAGRGVPVPVTAMRMRPPPFQLPASGRPRTIPVTETIPSPPSRPAPDYVPPVVRSPITAGPWEVPMPPVMVTRSRTMVPGSAPTALPFDYMQPVDPNWYGLGIVDDAVTPAPDGGVPDGGGMVMPGIDAGVVPDAMVAMGALVADPVSVDLGTSAWNVISAAKRVTIRNSGGQSSGALTFGFMGGAAAEFSIAAATCGAPLAAGATCTLDVAFKAKTPGEIKTTLVVTGSLAGATNVPVSGTGLVSQLVVNEAVHDFGSVKIGQESAVSVFIYTNTGNAATDTLIFFGGSAELVHFPAENNCYNRILPAGGSCTISVRFKPGMVGKFSVEPYFESGASGPIGNTSWIGTGIP
jgi:hypothetical protein